MTWILAGAVLVTAGALGAGRAAWRWREPHWAYALACGAPLLSLGVFLLLLFGLASKAALIALCLGGAALGTPGWRRIPHWTRPPWITLVFAPFVVLYAVNALAPPVQPDAVTYHLGLVAEWLRLHGFAARIGFYEMLPLGLETLFAPAVAVGGYSSASVFHFFLLCATVPLLWRIGTQLGLQRETAAGASALYALSPIVGMSGTAAYNDAAGVFFTVAVFALLLEDWREPGTHWLAYAGLAAGFCYAVKITGLHVVIVALAWILWKRRWRGAAVFLTAALVSILPWMLRDLLLTGNPVAPLGNNWFPNDAFHAATENSLSSYLRDYGASWRQLPWSIAVDGVALQGLIGPIFLLLPLALFAWKKPAGRAVLAAAAVLTLPWTQNVGARFIMPALAFYALALAMVLPRQLLAVVVLLHAFSAWPAVMNTYTNQWAWRLKGLPWEAAFRVQSEDSYLTANLYEYSFLKKAAQHLKPNEPLLDLYGLPYAYLPTAPLGPLPSAAFDNIAGALDLAAGRLPEQLYSMQCDWPQQFVRAVRIRMENPFPAAWSISEAGLLRDGRAVKISRDWFLRSWPEQGDAWLAVDGNRASRWQSWSRSKAGMTWELRFDRPVPLDGMWAMMANVDSNRVVAMYVQRMDRQWKKVSDRAVMQAPANRMYRRSAILFAKNSGYRWIAVRIGPGGRGSVGESFLASPDVWGVELVDRVESIGLFRIR
ncbi:ArnT family glycosyltransferase [Paludibaculum fermentans]|uniref:Glycosyltransferase family 39 protein n=1 Tax=Paludibaculum fermentans TaxID=1473598 RepID=A0A7S7NTW4_PALFE|nr:phospholipid carrier-dependent glycosyltransferase [Paludibaculum fermentans]QOY89670.1 glycosyltransferase family 39 protein [Paludibaculum fermentans]